MKAIVILIAALALSARAETYTLTNGCPVSGVVVSSIVAQVVIKTPLGQLRQIPVAAFCKDDRARLPEDAAGIYVNFTKARAIAVDMVKSSQKLIEDSSKSVLQDADLSAKTRAMIEKGMNLTVEVSAWREANEIANATATDRRLFVAECLMKYQSEKDR